MQRNKKVINICISLWQGLAERVEEIGHKRALRGQVSFQLALLFASPAIAVSQNVGGAAVETSASRNAAPVVGRPIAHKEKRLRAAVRSA